ncbi:MAG: sigma-E factor negative regulatory protein [Gammaproteobacteria bacterium]|nr:sigma-E factor negative regulatory protein [Gammaproteobacteria bacterium]NNJ50158.1 sigma-E factor negative regulatory protein [Gammaproteobacteria bacterium]
MSKRKEKISAFLDNDMHRDELMSFSLSAEHDDAKVAQRYQMIGDSLRGEVSDSSFVDVSAAVREALADENIADQVAADSGPSRAEPTTGKAGLFDLSGWFKPLAGMAVAASVAVVMVVTVTQQEGPAIAPVATDITTQPEVQLAVEDNTHLQNTVENKDTDLNPYINQHLEFATQDSLQGRMPYVRAVSFEQKK